MAALDWIAWHIICFILYNFLF